MFKLEKKIGEFLCVFFFGKENKIIVVMAMGKLRSAS
jgi:hypothetical protein